jgi:hypothetical protein
LDDSVAIRSNEIAESQMDKIKYTLDDLRVRINDMRKKFRQFVIKSKRNAAASSNKSDSEMMDDVDGMSSDGNLVDDNNQNDQDNEDLIKVSVYIKDQSKIITFRVNRKCKVRELKSILCEKQNDSRLTLDDLLLTYNGLELINNSYSISDYAIGDKSTITLNFRK